MKLKVTHWPGFVDSAGKKHGPGAVIEVSEKDGEELLLLNPHIFEVYKEIQKEGK